jgi:arylsulfatase K
MRQRNIIFFHAESWDGRMLGALGHPALANATPNIDRIAERGTLFENAYCTHPICCPSRANMWSGRYTHHCESWNNYKGLETGMWSLLAELPRTHTVGTFGKLDYLSGGHSQLARLSAWLGPSGIDKPVFDADTSQCFTVADDEEVRCHERDWRRVDQAIEYLREHKDDERPFFLYVSTGLVHAAFHTNNYWLNKIPEDQVDIPPRDENDHPVRQYQLMAKAWRYGYDDDTVRQVRRIYMAMCAEADAMVGALYDAMQDLGLGGDTFFVFSSDHGEMALEHQDWYKMTLYEGSVRVPLVMAGPGIRPRQRVRNLVSLIDLCPTFIEMGGLPDLAVGPGATPVQGGLDGESLMPLATGRTADSRDWAYACFMGCTLNTSGYMLRKDRWKYVAYAGYAPQLYDIENDPGELVDLSEVHPDTAARLDADLRAVVDYERTHRDWTAYCKDAFRQWRRQAKRGLYVDASYALRNRPSNDYWAIMDNCFTGYDQDDEAKVEAWLDEERA